MNSNDKKNLTLFKSGNITKTTNGRGTKVNTRRKKSEKQEDNELLLNFEEPEDEGHFQFQETPPYINNGKMRDYQVHGLNWLISLYENCINGILADEMGLGKTLQTISFLGYLKVYLKVKKPQLIVVPKSTLNNWKSELTKWCPCLNSVLLQGTKDERQEIIQTKFKKGFKWDVCITSFEICIKEKPDLKKIEWECIVIDEAHRIKNENSVLSQVLRSFKGRNRLLLTGTPLQNDLHELWALLNFLLPDIFSSADDFESWFSAGNDPNDQDSSDSDTVDDRTKDSDSPRKTKPKNQELVVKQLHKVLGPFLLRRLKNEVEKSLLPKKRIDLYVGMSSMQRQWYKGLLENDISALNGIVDAKGGTTKLQNIVMQLRKCCNHPYLFEGAEPGPPYTTDQHLIDNAGKLVLLDKLLLKLKAQGSRVLIFSQMSRMLDILEDYCEFKEFDFCRLDGQTAHADRISMIEEFNAPDSEKFIFLLTTRAGGLGINLATADTVIIYDNDWNPQVDLQAEDRAHRIGQKKQVVIFRFITENAVEEKVIDRASQKLRLDQLVIQQGRQANAKVATSKEQLVELIRFGAEDIFASQDATISSSDDLASIIEKSEAKTRQLETKYRDMGLEDLQQFTSERGRGDDGFNTYHFEGQDFREKKEGDNFVWIGPGANGERPKRRQTRRVSYAYGGTPKSAGKKDKATLKDEESASEGGNESASSVSGRSAGDTSSPIKPAKKVKMSQKRASGADLHRKQSLPPWICIGMLDVDIIMLEGQSIPEKIIAGSLIPVQISALSPTLITTPEISTDSQDKPPMNGDGAPALENRPNTAAAEQPLAVSLLLTFADTKAPFAKCCPKFVTEIFPILSDIKFDTRAGFNRDLVKPYGRVILYTLDQNAKSVGNHLKRLGRFLSDPDVSPKQRYFNPHREKVTKQHSVEGVAKVESPRPLIPRIKPPPEPVDMDLQGNPKLKKVERSPLICLGLLFLPIDVYSYDGLTGYEVRNPDLSVLVMLSEGKDIAPQRIDFIKPQTEESQTSQLNIPIASVSAHHGNIVLRHILHLRFESRVSLTAYPPHPYPIAKLLVYGKRVEALRIGRDFYENGIFLHVPDIRAQEEYCNPQDPLHISNLI